MIIVILAADENNGIAKSGSIPWYSKKDFDFFRETTIGKGNNMILMGRKTRESISRWPLPKRINITMTSTPHTINEVSSWDQVIELKNIYDDIFIIGGADIYRQAFAKKIPDKIYISRIFGNYTCDKFIDMNLIRENYRFHESVVFEDFTLEIWLINS